MIFIIPCGAKKRNEPCQACDMYVGNYFKACLRFAESKTKEIYILSAKYGLIKQTQMIAPYNLHMKDSKISIEQIKAQATMYGIINNHVAVIGGGGAMCLN